jgi:hypothetical protein
MGAGNYTGNLKANNHCYQGHLPKDKLRAGSTEGKIEIRINERTWVYVSKNKTKSQIREIYERFIKHIESYHYLDNSGNTVTI